MVAHALVWGKLLLVVLVVFAVLLGVVGGVYLCFTISTALGAAVVAALVVGVPTGLYFVLRRLSRTGVLERLKLFRCRVGVGEGTPAARQEQKLLGRTGLAETSLHPSGAVRVDQQRIIATAESGFIEKGATVRIIKALAMNVVVREVNQSQQT